MPIQPKHRLDDSRPKAVRQFTDREEFIEAFQKVLKEIKPDEQNVVVFYGVGGIGKTSLRKELGRILEKEQPKIAWTVLDFSIPHYREQETALFTLRKSLGDKYKIPFPSFDLAYAVYWQKTHPQTPLTKENFPLLDAGGIVVDIVTLFGEIPGIGLIPKVSKLVIKGKKALEDWWTKRGNKELYDLPQMEPKDILERLPMFWAGDLKDSLEQKDTQAVIFIDTYEALWGKERTEGTLFKRDEWMRELVAQLPGILWIICGREKLRWEEVEPDWGKALDQHLLGGLAEEDAERFLRSCGIEDKEIQRTIIEGGKGVPYYLDLAVDTYFEIKERHRRNPSPADFAQTHQEILERFLLYLDRAEIETLKVLSVARKWDKSIFELLVTHFKTGYPISAFPELCRFSFINQDETPGTWHMHELMRESLQEKIEPDSQREVHKCLFDYYNEELKGINIKNITDMQCNVLKESYYHGKNALEEITLCEWFRGVTKIFNEAAQWSFLAPLFENMVSHIEGKHDPSNIEEAALLNEYVLLLIHLGKYSAGEAYCKRALTIQEKLLEPDHPDIAQTIENLATLSFDKGNFEEAENLFKKALSIQAKAKTPTDPTIIKIKAKIASLHLDQDKYSEAENEYKEVLALLGKSNNLKGREAAYVFENLGIVYEKIGKYSEAESYYKQALEIKESIYSSDHPQIGWILSNLAHLNPGQRKYEETEALYGRAIKIMEKACGPEHSFTARIMLLKASFYTHQGRYEEAELLCIKVLKIMNTIFGPDHFETANTLVELAWIKYFKGNYDEAEKLHKRAIEIREKTYGLNNLQVAKSLNGLADLYKAQGRYNEAHPLYLQTVRITEKILTPDHPYLIDVLNDIADLYSKMGKHEEQKEIEERIKKCRTGVS